MKRRYSGGGYMALLRRRARLGRGKAYERLGRIAATYRRRMIAVVGRINRRSVRGNPSGHTKGRMSKSKCAMDLSSKRLFAQVTSTSAGKQVASLFTKFWKVKCPPSVKVVSELPGKGTGKPVSLMGMGETQRVFLSSGDKGQHGKKTRTVLGRWYVASDPSGKHVILLSVRNKKISGPLKAVGYAPRTDYVPPPDVEKAGTHKKGYYWKHLHGERDGKDIPLRELHWPVVYADRGGKVDKDSNFLYGSTKHGKIGTWMFH